MNRKEAAGQISLSLGGFARRFDSMNEIETFPNPYPRREYWIDISSPEFTCLCPMTGRPDFATIRIRYVPGPKCLELKALKLYLQGYRNQGAFHEKVTNQILDDLVACCDPIRLEVVGDFNVRGGIKTVVTASYESPQSKAQGPRSKVQGSRSKVQGPRSEVQGDA